MLLGDVGEISAWLCDQMCELAFLKQRPSGVPTAGRLLALMVVTDRGPAGSQCHQPPSLDLGSHNHTSDQISKVLASQQSGIRLANVSQPAKSSIAFSLT